MGSFPYGPHGPQTRPYDPTPNPTAPSPFPQIGGAEPHFAQAGSYSGPSGPVATGSGGPFLSFTTSLLMLPFVWMFWICLYPLTAIVGGVVGGVTTSMA